MDRLARFFDRPGVQLSLGLFVIFSSPLLMSESFMQPEMRAKLMVPDAPAEIHRPSKNFEKDAVIKMWDEPYPKRSCHAATPAATISLSPDICFTNVGFQSSDLQIKHDAICADGKAPTFIAYPHAGCIESINQTEALPPPPPLGDCMHMDTKELFRWSMIFKCAEGPEGVQNDQNKSDLKDNDDTTSVAPKSTMVHSAFTKDGFNTRTTQKTFKPDICHGLESPITIIPAQCKDSVSPYLFTYVRRDCQGQPSSHGMLEHSRVWNPKEKHPFSLVLSCDTEGGGIPADLNFLITAIPVLMGRTSLSAPSCVSTYLRSLFGSLFAVYLYKLGSWSEGCWH